MMTIARCLSGVLALLFAGLPLGARAAPLEIVHDRAMDLDVIKFTGEIKPGSFGGLGKLIDEAAKRNPPNQVFLALDSPGGLIEEATNAGEIVRRRGVGTVLLPGATCTSACSYVFFAGYDAVRRQPRRLAFTRARIGLHSSHIRYKAGKREAPAGTETNEIYAFLQARIGRLLNYLNQMKVPPEVQERIFSTPSQAMHYLTPNEKLSLKVVDVTMTGGRWTAEASEVTIPASLSDRSRATAAAAAMTPPVMAPVGQSSAQPASPVSGSTWITVMPPRPHPRFPHRPQTVAARWTAGARSGVPCLEISDEQSRVTLGMTICARGKSLDATLDFRPGTLDTWNEVLLVATAKLSGAPKFSSVIGQGWRSTGVPGVSGIRFTIDAPASLLTPSEELYQIRLEFSPAGAQEITVFVPPEMRAALRLFFGPATTEVGSTQ